MCEREKQEKRAGEAQAGRQRRTWMFISTWFAPCSSITGRTRKGRLTLSVIRYRMSSNSPSGGTNVIERSASNFK